MSFFVRSKLTSFAVSLFIVAMALFFVAMFAHPVSSDAHHKTESRILAQTADVSWNDACQPSRGGNYAEAGVFSGNTAFLNDAGKLEWKTHVVSNVSGDLYSFGVIQFNAGCGEAGIVPNGFIQTRIHASPGDDIVFRRQADTDGKPTWIPFNATTGVEGTEGTIVLDVNPATYAGGLQFEICTASFYCARSGHFDYPANPAGTVYLDAPTPTPTPTEILPYQSSGFRYQVIAAGATPPEGFEQPNFDDSSWSQGQAAFGSGGICALQPSVKTIWPTSTQLLVRRGLSIPAEATNVRVMMAVDNDVTAIFFNGVQISAGIQHSGCPSLNDLQINVPQNLVQAGQNTVIYHLIDQGFESYFDTRITASVSSLPVPTATGFFYPLGLEITGDANWNACGADYFESTRHIGADLFYDSAIHNNDNNIGKPVYAISKGTLVVKSGPSECSGWGIGNFALAIQHSSTTGDFIAVYGHIHTDLNVGDQVSAGDRIGMIAPYEEHESYGRDTAKVCKFSGNIITRKAHVHFGVFPSTDKFRSKSGWGRIQDTKCMHPDSTDGFVNPLDWIRTKIPLN
jgi:hypothetical protein